MPKVRLIILGVILVLGPLTFFSQLPDELSFDSGYRFIGPKEANAAAVILSCKDYCKSWSLWGACCEKEKWKQSTSAKCMTLWTCSKE
jgi:hypothetical protein